MTTITNSSFVVNHQHNEHSQAAIEAVAFALQENAKALAVLAGAIEVDFSNSSIIHIQGDSSNFDEYGE